MATIALVTPAYDGRVHDDHARSVDAGRSALIRAGHKVVRLCLTGDAVLPRVRNQCVAEALARGAEHIVMIDSDIGFDPPALERLVSHDADIVGAAPQAQLRSWRDAANPRCVWRPFPGGDAVTNEQGLVEAAGLATGFLSVRANVFREMVKQGKARPYIYPGIAPTAWPHLAAYFDYELAPVLMTDEIKRQCREVGVDDAPLHWVGEDYYFCNRAREIGFTCWMDAGIGVRHWEGRSKHDFSVAEMMSLSAEEAA